MSHDHLALLGENINTGDDALEYVLPTAARRATAGALVRYILFTRASLCCSRRLLNSLICEQLRPSSACAAQKGCGSGGRPREKAAGQ